MEVEAVIGLVFVSLVLVGVFVWLALRRSSAAGKVVSQGTFHQPFPTVSLVYIGGPNAGERMDIRGRRITIGRSPNCEIRLDDPLVSWEHASIAYDGERYVLYDLDSTNGTWVNNQRIAQKTIALGQDQIRIGPAVIVLQASGADRSPPDPLPLQPSEKKRRKPSKPVVQRLADYKIVGELGRGGASTVYKARSKTDGQIVAIKVLNKPDPYLQSKFDNEMGVLPELLSGHPHIVQVFGGDYDARTGRPYLIMEFMEGGVLRDQLRQGQPLPPNQVISIAGQVCDALNYAHRKGIYHRDLKPENIFFDTHDKVKLGDFGIARLSQAVTVTSSGFLIGTPLYMSYEQAKGVRDLDGRSDLYSLGAVLYEMVTGYPPFMADTPLRIVDKHLMEKPTPPSHINSEVMPHIEDVIMRALAKDRNRRFQVAEHMAQALGYNGSMHAGGSRSFAARKDQGRDADQTSRRLSLVRSDGYRIPLDGKSEIPLGRGTVNPDDTRMSRKHARLFKRDGYYWIEDSDSANGTFVNGQRLVSQPQALRSGDDIQMGQTRLRLERDG